MEINTIKLSFVVLGSLKTPFLSIGVPILQDSFRLSQNHTADTGQGEVPGRSCFRLCPFPTLLCLA